MSSLRGDQALIANIGGLARHVAGPGLDRDVRESLEPVRAQAAENAKRLRQPETKNGQHLDQGIVNRKIRQSTRTRRIFWVALRRRARRIGHLVEFGTRPHAQPRRGIFHPGARAKPWFRPAFEAKKGEVLQVLSRRLWARIRSSPKKR